MAKPPGMKVESARVALPMWLQCIVALVGLAALAGPAAAVVWYR
ncbi:MAG: hypothetical protein ACRYGP_16800 [Janthinobacterium lividum]